MAEWQPDSVKNSDLAYFGTKYSNGLDFAMSYKPDVDLTDLVEASKADYDNV